MDRELLIKLALDHAKASAAGAAYAAEEKQRIGQVLGAAEQGEAARTAVTAKGTRQRTEAGSQAMRSEEERLGKLLSATEVAERAKAAIVERTNRQRVEAAVRAEMGEEQVLTKLLTKWGAKPDLFLKPSVGMAQQRQAVDRPASWTPPSIG